jgi:enoyl-CoA hydratase
MGNQFVNVSQDDHVTTVTLNNPPANALSSPLMAELGNVLDDLAENANVKAVVVTGSGTIFVAGADIKEIATITASKQGEELTSKGQAIFNKIERLHKPTIAAITGFCLGGGLELAMACHLRICGDRARLGQPEINLGIIPGFGGTQRLSRLVGRAKALELILTGDMINAQEAKSLGLVNKVVPEGEVLKQALGLAKKIASKGGKALSAVLRAVQEGSSTLCETANMKEGISAFLEKRQPKFKDQ